MIAIVDYGAGNLRSIQRALTNAGAESVITADVDKVRAADRIVLPGVGNAAAAMARLRESGMADTIVERAQAGTPLLGVCLGMQLLFGDQEEGPTIGLSLLDGSVRALPADRKVPQMGWNRADFGPGNPMSHLQSAHYYFVHSYIVHPTSSDVIAAETAYGVRFPSVVARENVWGFQFHPEKSGEDGLKLVETWVNWNP